MKLGYLTLIYEVCGQYPLKVCYTFILEATFLLIQMALALNQRPKPRQYQPTITT